ncbi:MAG: MFS transporter [Candidatus Omnitrophota bacterium]|jgi:EmrB/QacA subfamily drug resistance transporter
MEDYTIKDTRKQALVAVIAAVSVFMNTLDYSMLNISLPAVSKYFHVNLAAIAWLPLTYLLIVTSSLLGFGKLGDIRGYRRIFVLGMGVFTAGTLMCGFAPTMRSLLAFRAFQSVGEAISSPIAIAMVTSFLPANVRGRALGVVALAQGLGMAAGAAAGGYINSHFMWRAIFFINIPIGIAVILASLKVLPKKQREVADKRFDIPGAVTIFVALASLLFFMNSITRLGFKNPVMIGCLAISMISFLIFIIQEKMVPYPLLDLGLFRNMNFTLAVTSSFLATFVVLGFSFLAPFYIEFIRGSSVSTAGVMLMIPSLVMMALAPFAGRISDQIGSRVLCSIGAAIFCFVFAALAVFGANTNIALIVISFFALGVAAGIFMAPNNKLVMLQAPEDKQGVASGVYKMFLNTGSVMGIALFPMIIMGKIHSLMMTDNIDMAQVKQSPEIMCAGFRSAFLFAIAACLLMFIFSFFARDKK